MLEFAHAGNGNEFKPTKLLPEAGTDHGEVLSPKEDANHINTKWSWKYLFFFFSLSKKTMDGSIGYFILSNRKFWGGKEACANVS